MQASRRWRSPMTIYRTWKSRAHRATPQAKHSKAFLSVSNSSLESLLLKHSCHQAWLDIKTRFQPYLRWSDLRSFVSWPFCFKTGLCRQQLCGFWVYRGKHWLTWCPCAWCSNCASASGRGLFRWARAKPRTHGRKPWGTSFGLSFLAGRPYQHSTLRYYMGINKLLEYGLAYQREELAGSKNASLYEITLGCCMLASILTSLIAFKRSFSFIVVI